MCTFNGERYVQEQLESIAAQSTPPDELVVCDDRSSDATLQMLQAFRQRCAFPVRIFQNCQTLGILRNFEKAIGECSGDLIFLADQDDVWHPAKVEVMSRAFRAHPSCGYVFSNAALVNADGTPRGRDLWHSIGFDHASFVRYAAGAQLDVMLRGNAIVYGMTMAFRSEFLPCLLPIDSRSDQCLHDTWIALVLSAKGAYGAAIPDRLVNYRQHAAQAVGGVIKRLGFRNYVEMIRESASEGNPALADSFINITARVQRESQKRQSELRAMNLLTDKATHLRRRFLASSSTGRQRLGIVFRELISGRYNQFSGGLKSVVRDSFAVSNSPLKNSRLADSAGIDSVRQ